MKLLNNGQFAHSSFNLSKFCPLASSGHTEQDKVVVHNVFLPTSEQHRKTNGLSRWKSLTGKIHLLTNWRKRKCITDQPQTSMTPNLLLKGLLWMGSPKVPTRLQTCQLPCFQAAAPGQWWMDDSLQVQWALPATLCSFPDVLHCLYTLKYFIWILDLPLPALL